MTTTKINVNMKKILASLILALMVTFLHAQEYKLAKSTGRLEIKEVNNVIIEGTTGNEIIFTSRDTDKGVDERAKGLRAVSGLGLEDNSGIGLSVVEKGNVIEVQQLKKMNGPNVTIKVPKGVTVSFSHVSPHGNDVKFKDFEGEIEVSTVHNAVSLINVTGPMTVKTVHGSVDAILSPNIKSPVSIVSVHGRVDVTLPVATKANLKMSTVYGEIYVDPDFKIDIAKVGDLIPISDNVTGKINGGGLDISLSSTHNNIYLRKK